MSCVVGRVETGLDASVSAYVSLAIFWTTRPRAVCDVQARFTPDSRAARSLLNSNSLVTAKWGVERRGTKLSDTTVFSVTARPAFSVPSRRASAWILRLYPTTRPFRQRMILPPDREYGFHAVTPWRVKDVGSIRISHYALVALGLYVMTRLL